MSTIERWLVGSAALVLMLGVGCGGEDPESDDQQDQQQQQEEFGEPPDELEERCEAACERIYAEDGCDTRFEDEDSVMSQGACVDACVDEDMMHGGAWCMATEAECSDDPEEMIEPCLPDDYHPEGCEDLGVWPHEYAEFEEEAVEELNKVRAETVDCHGQEFGPSGDVEMNERLRCAARRHSKDMIERGFYSTENPEGEGPEERAEQAGYEGEALGGRVGDFHPDAYILISYWIEDEDENGYCEDLMDPEVEEVGFGRYDLERTTVNFGKQQ